MITHRRMRARIAAFADGELSEAQHASVKRHLASCAECAALLSRFRESDRLFGAARPEPAALSPEASRALLARVLEEAGTRRAVRWPGSQPFSWAFGAALAVTAGAAFAWWSMAGPANPSGALARTGPSGVASGVLMVDTRANPEITAPGRKGAGKSSGRGGAPAPGQEALPKKESPGAKAPAEGPQPRRGSPIGLRYICQTPGRRRPPAGAVAPTPAAPSRPGGVELVSGPLPPSFAVQNGMLGSTAAVAGDLGPGEMLVLVSSEPAPSSVTVTCASPEAPGFARASALRPDGNGGWLWTEATAQTACAGPEHSLLLLGESAWPREEGQDDQVWGEADQDVGSMGVTPGAVGEPAGEPGRSGVAEPNQHEPGSESEPACDAVPARPDDSDPDADGC